MTPSLLWIIPLTLFILALLQLIYLIWLRVAPLDRGEARQPGSPIMPTMPQGGIATQPTSGGGMSLPPSFSGEMEIIGGLSNHPLITLPGTSFGIGRFENRENNIQIALDEKSISRRHAVFYADESRGEYFLTDTHSSYGSFIKLENRFERLTGGERTRIYNGDTIRFGNVVLARMILPGGPRPQSGR